MAHLEGASPSFVFGFVDEVGPLVSSTEEVLGDSAEEIIILAAHGGAGLRIGT